MLASYDKIDKSLPGRHGYETTQHDGPGAGARPAAGRLRRTARARRGDRRRPGADRRDHARTGVRLAERGPRLQAEPGEHRRGLDIRHLRPGRGLLRDGHVLRHGRPERIHSAQKRRALLCAGGGRRGARLRRGRLPLADGEPPERGGRAEPARAALHGGRGALRARPRRAGAGRGIFFRHWRLGRGRLAGRLGQSRANIRRCRRGGAHRPGGGGGRVQRHRRGLHRRL